MVKNDIYNSKEKYEKFKDNLELFNLKHEEKKPDGFVVIISQHFTSKEAASNVRVYRKFNPTDEDDYVYFIENGFYSLSKDEVRHLTGAQNAEVKFDVKFSVEAKRVWIKVEKQNPVKFAIEYGLYPDEIISLTASRLS